MSRKKISHFHILAPDVRTIYLGEGAKQKVRYLQHPEVFGSKVFEEDLAAGADIYASFDTTLALKPTTYNVITAPTFEDGARAVLYLDGIYAQMEGFTNHDRGEDYAAEIYQRETDLLNGDYLIDVDDLDDDGEQHYEESFDRIPLIEIRDVISEERAGNPFQGFGAFSVEYRNNGKRVQPWWIDCRHEAVCIVQNKAFGGLDPFCNETLDASELECLQRFSGNRKVYLLVVDPQLADDDYSISTAMLDYTANCFRVEQTKDILLRYHRKLFLSVAKEYGFSFHKSLDADLLADKLGRIDHQNPCDVYTKIMRYLTHVGCAKTLRPQDFESLGLRKMITQFQEGKSVGKMDDVLIGMDNVKKQMKNIIDTLRYVNLRRNRNIENAQFHNVYLFIGAPGTAKTTVAKMLADSMQSEGLLRGNRFISVTGAKLKGAYVGQTAPKVHEIFQCYDAIFIDEAYSLVSGSESAHGIDSYAQEALAQLAVELEAHAMDKLVIFAGYGGTRVTKKNNLMYKFLTANPGISSRINMTVNFDSYTPQDMLRIVHHLAEKASLKLTKDADEDIAAYFQERYRQNDFGNGREARNFIEQCQRRIAGRIAGMDASEVTDAQLSDITARDVQDVIAECRSIRVAQIGQNQNSYGLCVG
ncbi:MAG: AAA family ATPase [Lachnospiraceae bacterium]|nr:AAA family ATPase [Lachnospiraceae bacterium]